jgi:hypothetical protein
MHRYVIDIDYSDFAGDYPYAVFVTRLEESKEFYGKTLKEVLKRAIAAIEKEEYETA